MLKRYRDNRLVPKRHRDMVMKVIDNYYNIGDDWLFSYLYIKDIRNNKKLRKVDVDRALDVLESMGFISYGHHENDTNLYVILEDKGMLYFIR